MAPATIKTMSPSADVLDGAAKAGAYVLDVRAPWELQDGFIPSAYNMEHGRILQGALPEPAPAKDAPIIVYCRSGGRSSMVCKHLVSAGFTNVTNLAGGMTAWNQAGLPVASGGVAAA